MNEDFKYIAQYLDDGELVLNLKVACVVKTKLLFLCTDFIMI